MPEHKAHIIHSEQLSKRIAMARGLVPVDLVIKNATWLDVFNGAWKRGDIAIGDGVIVGVGETYEGRDSFDANGAWIVPGFIDSHVHIESSMMTPHRFAEMVMPHGTTTAIWDPHEIANVKGLEGIDWAISTTEGIGLDVFIMVPSCVPSTSPHLNIETSGACLNAGDLQRYVNHPRVLGLAEMMNAPGVVHADNGVLEILTAFQSKVRDGHCPGLAGKELNAYAVTGIHTCHESTTTSEALEKLSKGIHLLIREGSCARDADELLPVLSARNATSVGFCSDDRNPLDVHEAGHLDCIINKGLRLGKDPVDVFRAASFSTAKIYGLADRGAIAPGYIADLVLVRQRQPSSFRAGITVDHVWKRGCSVGEQLPRSSQGEKKFHPHRNLNLGSLRISPELFALPVHSGNETALVNVIGVRPGQILTDKLTISLPVLHNSITSDLTHDILKITVIERHHGSGRMGIGLVSGFGLKTGAIATSINHDCHNLIATGSSDELIAQAVSELVNIDGGIVVVAEDGRVERLRLPIAGLMTDEKPDLVTERLLALKRLTYACGCTLAEPFLQLSFLALPVIPALKITDCGLVDATKLNLISVVEA